MHLARVATGVLLCVAGVRVAAWQEPVFRSVTQTVPVYATVIDADGHLRTDLTRDDFEVDDNLRPQPLTLFDHGIQPIDIVIMLDMSGSMTGNISTLRRAATQMFTRLLPDDQARVGSFGDRITLGGDFTNNVDTLVRTLWTDLTPGGGTPLWGAVNVAMTALSHLNRRRVVLVLSDGKDTAAGRGRTGVTLDEVIHRAQAEDFMVYAIGLKSRDEGGAPASYPFGGGRFASRGGGGRGGGSGDEPDPGLRTLANETGGGYFELDPSDDLGATFARVADELHRQYLLGFRAPEADGALHAINVRVSAAGTTARARKNYLAPSPRTFHP